MSLEADMGMFHSVQVGDQKITPIDWEMNPALSFGTFESWGGRERVRNNQECVYYFFVDNWGDKPRLYLMERAVKHAKILAEIAAPGQLIEACVEEQGTSSIFEKSYAIDENIKKWLIENVLDGEGQDLIFPQKQKIKKEDMGPVLPEINYFSLSIEATALPKDFSYFSEEEMEELVARWGFFERELNPLGNFSNVLARGPAAGTVVDLSTSLMWQTGGTDIGSIRHIRKNIEEVNSNRFAGYSDWRLPTVEEALSLLESQKNSKGIYLHPCFSKEYPFIFVDARRKPGGYWFVDFKQARAFWSSGTIPGGFGRLVRSWS